MIQVEEKETIRKLYFNQRHSIREIAKERGHSRKTVKKAISDASVPDYHLTKTRPRPVMDPFKDIIGK
jgi:DNA invertase Pin-like site-specific DNA recombinase